MSRKEMMVEIVEVCGASSGLEQQSVILVV